MCTLIGWIFASFWANSWRSEKITKKEIKGLKKEIKATVAVAKSLDE
jgi:hypothetical protein